MILSQAELREAVEKGEVAFTPSLKEEQWGEASIDLRMGYQITLLKEVKGITISLSDGIKDLGGIDLWQTRELSPKDELGNPDVFEISPGQFALATTYESIKVPRNLIARIEGRSTYARFGLSMHQTAPWIQPGWSGPIILELMNSGSLKIKLTPAEDRPCQITFFKLTSEIAEEYAYGAKAGDDYQDQTHPLNPKGI